MRLPKSFVLHRVFLGNVPVHDCRWWQSFKMDIDTLDQNWYHKRLPAISVSQKNFPRFPTFPLLHWPGLQPSQDLAPATSARRRGRWRKRVCWQWLLPSSPFSTNPALCSPPSSKMLFFFTSYGWDNLRGSAALLGPEVNSSPSFSTCFSLFLQTSQ